MIFRGVVKEVETRATHGIKDGEARITIEPVPDEAFANVKRGRLILIADSALLANYPHDSFVTIEIKPE